MDILVVALLLLHVTFAALWLGGAVFIELVLVPRLGFAPLSRTLGARTGARFTSLAWISLGGLTLTGVLITYLNQGLSTSFLLNGTGLFLFTSIVLTAGAIANGLIISNLSRIIAGRDQLKAYTARKWIPRLVRLNSVLGVVIVVFMVVFTEGIRWY